MEFWYRQHYRLAATDPRFLEATPLEMLTDYYANYYMNNPNAQDEVEDEDFDLERELARIEAEAAGDIDDWEELE